MHVALPGDALTTFPGEFGPIFFLRPGGARPPSAPPGYAYAFTLNLTLLDLTCFMPCPRERIGSHSDAILVC